ncbi:MAG TPA: ACT domain-containing protein [Candidatus Hypogeohydataceae bacterium YC38]
MADSPLANNSNVFYNIIVMQEPQTNFLFDRQISLVLENLPGTLAEICSTLAQKEVNILGLSISDMVDTGELRMIVSHTEKAKRLLEARGYDVLESEVLLVEMSNRPGVLAKIAEKLAKGKVNIEYAYCAASRKEGNVMGVLKVSDTTRAYDILSAGE